MDEDRRKIFYVLAAIAGTLAAAFVYFAFPTTPSSPTDGSETYSGIYYFYSPSCHYCQQVKPYIEEMAQKYPITFCQVENFNSECKAVAEEIKLQGVPTIAIKNGKTTVLVGASEVLKLEEALK
jgi:thiol-disulfide isomerase/thioredoxin